MAKGIGFVSSRRAEEGLASNMDVRENIYLNPAASGKGVMEFVPRATSSAKPEATVRRFSIKTAGVEEPVATLSGGNQQKVVLARWMETHVKLLILEEPTIGVDVGAKADIYHLLQLSLRKGLAVLLISSDFEEVERICHRALVFSRGQVAAEIPGHALTIAALTSAASGGTWTARHGALREPRRRPVVQRRLTRAISVWGLLVLFVLLVIVFSWLRPDTFLTYFNIRSILSNKSVQLLVALSVFIPMVANQFDLSAGFNVGISQVLAIGLQGQGLPWWAAVCAVLLMGAAVGLVNGLLITRVKIDSFIATLGTGTILYGLNAWYTGGQQVLASLPPEFLAISGSVWIVPAPAIYALVASLTLWIVFEYLPLGRYLYVLGASPRAAELNGISAKRYITLGFVAAGTLAAFAGVVLQSQLQVGQSSVGQEYLLPAFTAALLGATSIRPGRVNVWGTVLAVAVLAVTVAGLNQLGAPFFVEPLFNGSMLILAVGLAVQAAQRRQRRGTQAENAAAAGAAAPVVE